MAFASKLPTTAGSRRSLKARGPVSLTIQRAIKLGKPLTIRMLTPAPVRGNDLAGLGNEQPSTWDAANKGILALSSVVGTGTKFYVDREQTKQLQQQADMADAKAAAAQRAAETERQYMIETQRAAALAAASRPSGMPPWVLPVAIGGVLIAGLGGFFLLRKKRV